MEADVQREPRVPGDPTNHRLFGHIADAARPVEVWPNSLASHTSTGRPVPRYLGMRRSMGLVVDEVEISDRPSRPAPCCSTRGCTRGTGYSGIN
jgi:hypothetical protein